MLIIGVIFGIIAGVVLLFLFAPLFAGMLTNDPQNPDKIAFFTSVEPGQAKAVMRGGQFKYFLYNREGYGPIESQKNTTPGRYWFFEEGQKIFDGASLGILPWSLWKKYVRRITGLETIGVWPFQTIYTYELPQVKRELVEGTYQIVAHPESRSDHVRIRPFTWYFRIEGAEIERIPFRIEGSVQVIGENPFLALFNTDSWNIVIDQAIASAGRDIVQAQFTLSDVIGSVLKELDDSNEEIKQEHQTALNKISGALQGKLSEYALELGEGTTESQTLKSFIGLTIGKVEITDLIPELEEEQLERLRAEAFARPEASAREIEGKGEQAYLGHVSEALKDPNGALAAYIEGRVRAADASRTMLMDIGGDGNQMNALLTAILEKTKGGEDS